MATMVLAAAGGALGASVGGGVAGVGAAALGRALGAVAGGVIDQRILGGGARVVESGRVAQVRVMGSREGAAIPRVYGRMRLSGQVIWASRFQERSTVSGGGGKGAAPRTRSFSYAISLALALCEGPVARIGRMWADGKPFDASRAEVRLHRGGEDQAPDPLIEAVEGAGAAPAYRGVAYLVIEDLDLADFGDRVPQFSVEAFREPDADPALSDEIAPPLGRLIEAVALSPGSGEFALETEPVRRRLGPGASVSENVNSLDGRADALAALDQLEAEAPQCRAASLVVSWFGDDLRCDRCRIEPAVEEAHKITEPVAWRVAGLSRDAAKVVGRRDGRPVFGGTPSDRSVLNSIAEMKRRGLDVMFYPFVLMDVAPGSGKPNPYGAGAQPAYPWRGRVTLDAAPGTPGSSDGAAAAADEVAAFFGAARPADFVREGDTVRYAGAPEWGLRRFILHYAHLCAMAGGVSAFCIGSELRGLTWIRSGRGVYPAVAALRALAADVRAILGPGVKIGYAADWSEYFGHQPGDGSGDVLFHLDPLWADPNVDFIGIDNYMPLADWRDGDDHLDAGAGSIHALSYLQGNIEGGEGFHWFYASDADRAAQRRSPITDGAHGEHWVFRYKDIRSWWRQPHHDRPGGVRAAAPTAWIPQSKPIWFTEIGCPAVDKGANQPNVFLDAKSSEDAAPYFSTRARDEHMQRRFLQAALGYWRDPARNPVSPIYGGPMVETARSFVWTWDLRPWPDFPQRLNVWADGDNHALGHWITGRLGAAGLAEVVAEICAEAGLRAIDVSLLHATVDGYAQESVQSARQALQPLMLAYGFDAVESGGVVRFAPRGGAPVAALALSDMAARDDADGAAGPLTVTRGPAAETPQAVRVGFVRADSAYEAAAVEAQAEEGAPRRVDAADLGIAMASDAAQRVADRWLAEGALAGEEATFALPPSYLALEPGDVVRLPGALGAQAWRIERIVDAGRRAVSARRVAQRLHRPSTAPRRRVAPPPLPLRAPVEIVTLDLPALGGDPAPTRLHVAAFARPWPGAVAVHRATGPDSFAFETLIERPATVGVLVDDLPAAAPHRWMGGGRLRVRLFGGALASREAASVLRGANTAAVEAAPGVWEVLQFREAELAAPGEYRLDGLLRGQAGTEAFIAAPTPAGARFVLLDGAPGRLEAAADEIGLATRYRIGPAHLPLGDAAFVEMTATPAAVGLRPYAPVHLTATRDGAGGFALRWTRRTRQGGDVWGVAEAPLAEESERYRVRVTQAGVVARSFETTAPSARYDAAMRAEDALVGQFGVSVAQVSAAFGPGPETRIIING